MLHLYPLQMVLKKSLWGRDVWFGIQVAKVGNCDNLMLLTCICCNKVRLHAIVLFMNTNRPY